MVTRGPTGPLHVEGTRPDPSTLPRPKLFSSPPPGRQASGYTTAGDFAPRTARQSRKVAMIAVATMIIGTIFVALGVVFWSWPYMVAGGAVGGIGVFTGWRVHLLEQFSEGESPTSSF